MARSYAPDAGDIVWISFDPQPGHEQAGHRPAVVLSPAAYKRQDEPHGLLPDDDADQELSLRGGPWWPESERGFGRSGQEPRLAQKAGQAERDDIDRRTGRSSRQNSGAHRLKSAAPSVDIDLNGAIAGLMVWRDDELGIEQMTPHSPRILS